MWADQLKKQKNFFLEHRKLPISHRKILLSMLESYIQNNQTTLIEAFWKDFAKPEFEVAATEIFPVLSELKFHLKNLTKWSRPQKVRNSLLHMGCDAFIQPEPKGVVLIIGPWNYPFTLTLQPLVSAIAAGNTVFLKPSELTPHVSTWIENMLSELFSEELIFVLQGGKEITQQLLKLPFDHIFFTGSTHVGKLVMQAAAENLTPVTLELGGKSPCIVAADCDLSTTAKKIIWGKVLNNGQTCVAPDYLLVDATIYNPFLEFLRNQYRTQATQTCRVIHQQAQNRLSQLKAGQNVVDNFFVLEPDLHSPIMQEEIFGPLLPILKYDSIEDALRLIQNQPKPLSLYLFTQNSNLMERLRTETSSGGLCINDVVTHLGHPRLPFGGIGPSGMGRYHGKFGFLEFSHLKSVLVRKRFSAITEYFYPPYNKKKIDLFKGIMKWL
jgi:aldehyde dehydrogenase (NAD+)